MNDARILLSKGKKTPPKCVHEKASPHGDFMHTSPPKGPLNGVWARCVQRTRPVLHSSCTHYMRWNLLRLDRLFFSIRITEWGRGVNRGCAGILLYIGQIFVNLSTALSILCYRLSRALARRKARTLCIGNTRTCTIWKTYLNGCRQSWRWLWLLPALHRNWTVLMNA